MFFSATGKLEGPTKKLKFKTKPRAFALFASSPPILMQMLGLLPQVVNHAALAISE